MLVKCAEQHGFWVRRRIRSRTEDNLGNPWSSWPVFYPAVRLSNTEP